VHFGHVLYQLLIFKSIKKQFLALSEKTLHAWFATSRKSTLRKFSNMTSQEQKNR